MNDKIIRKIKLFLKYTNKLFHKSEGVDHLFCSHYKKG